MDKNNRVIAVGNPVYNPKIKKLYFNIISGKKPFLPCNAEQRKKNFISILFLVRNLFYRVMQNKEQMLVWINDF
ncbi:hypothetical protein DW069_02735 [Bacteroides thetaiotaomicron]|nr:hypothetical protein DW069_02735 [Bacteroides thetaiotaomicron]